MPSKLDYLSKYTAKPKKKKKKKKVRERDDDEDIPPLPPPPVETDEEEEDAETGAEDGPVVVAQTEEVGDTGPQGVWEVKTVGKMKRHDSSSSENDASAPRRVRPRSNRRMGTSSSDDNEAVDRSRPSRRYDTDDSSSNDGATTNQTTVRKRYDSDSSSSSTLAATRKRHDSSDEEESTKDQALNRHDSSSDEDETRDRMSSGHRAGLQSGGDFASKESKIQSKRRLEAKETVDKYGVGETVYRSKTGDSKTKKAKKALSAEEHKLLHSGRVQLEMEERAKREFQEIQQSSFARHADDEALEEQRKREIRADDPMAKFSVMRQQQTARSSNGEAATTRPVYKGPPPRPNRFGIPPGHRWDAHDRGNGFEDKLLARLSSSRHEQEQAYRHSAADM